MYLENVNKLLLNDREIKPYLEQITPRPAQLYSLGEDPRTWLALPKVAVVGSRKATPYGRAVTKQLVEALSRRGVVIISGLALGIDSIAHQTAISAGGLTVAILPTPLDSIYPASHLGLARQIIDSGGCILSEYPPGAPVYQVNFIARNRIVSGLADILLITEAVAKSGTMHTARFALEQGKTVMAVPGNISSPSSEGCNNLIKSGAIPVTNAGDILFALGIKESPEPRLPDLSKFSEHQQTLLKLISKGMSDQEDLAINSKLDGAQVVSALTGLELSGAVRPEGAGRWTLS